MNPPSGKEFCKELERSGWLSNGFKGAIIFMARRVQLFAFRCLSMAIILLKLASGNTFAKWQA
jgi:hypothetical protein